MYYIIYSYKLIIIVKYFDYKSNLIKLHYKKINNQIIDQKIVKFKFQYACAPSK